MNSVFRQWKTRFHCSNKSIVEQNHLVLDDEFQMKQINEVFDRFTNENRLLRFRFDQLEKKLCRWINDDQVHLLKRIERLENENKKTHDIYQTYYSENKKCLQSLNEIILKIVSTQREISKQYTERENLHEQIYDKKKSSKQEQLIGQTTRSRSCHFSTNHLCDSSHMTNEQSVWDHQRLMIGEEQDQKTTNYSSKQNSYSSTLATNRFSSNDPIRRNFVVIHNNSNNTKIQAKSTYDKRHITRINVVPKQSTLMLNKNRHDSQQTIHSNHNERQSNTIKATTCQSKSIRVPVLINMRECTPIRSHYTLAKPAQSIQLVSPPVPLRTNSTKVFMNKEKKLAYPIKTRIPIPIQTPARSTDLDKVMNERNKNSSIIAPESTVKNIPHALFTKDNLKLVRPVRSDQLKLFSEHLLPTLESTISDSPIEQTHQTACLNNSSMPKDFSQDSLSEHYQINKLLKTTNETEQFYLLNDKTKLKRNSSLIKPIDSSLSKKSFAHRLLFPGRIGRMIFHRRILSDSDIYQKICTKDNEVDHNVYHLDTTRDYSMEFYMLTTYVSDSQLAAWIDSSYDDIVESICHMNESDTKNKISNDSLVRDEEPDWFSEFGTFNLSCPNQQKQEKNENSISYSSELPLDELLRDQQFSMSSLAVTTASNNSSDSSSMTSASWVLPNKYVSPPYPFNIKIDRNICSQNVQTLTNTDQYNNDPISSIVTDEFQPNFYYLSPMSQTTSFSKIDPKALYHEF